MFHVIILLICIAMPTFFYILLNRQMLQTTLRVSNKTAFEHLYRNITYPIFIAGAVLIFLICMPIVRQYWGLVTVVSIVIAYIVIASLIQGILFVITAPEHLHRPIKAVLPITIMANGITIVVILVSLPLLIGAMGMIYMLVKKIKGIY